MHAHAHAHACEDFFRAVLMAGACRMCMQVARKRVHARPAVCVCVRAEWVVACVCVRLCACVRDCARNCRRFTRCVETDDKSARTCTLNTAKCVGGRDLDGHGRLYSPTPTGLFILSCLWIHSRGKACLACPCLGKVCHLGVKSAVHAGQPGGPKGGGF